MHEMCIRWEHSTSSLFTVSTGVRQGVHRLLDYLLSTLMIYQHNKNIARSEYFI